MGILVSKSGPNQQEETEAALRSERVAVTLSLSILGAAVAYFGALYLIVH